MTRSFGVALASLVFLAGCIGESGNAERRPIALDRVSSNVMKAAKEKLPGVTFTRAAAKSNGDYEVLGRDLYGTMRRVVVTSDGVATEVK